MTALLTIDLHCEYRRDPLGIDVRAPRLGWALEGGERDAVQSAYRIRVSRAVGGAELWDSGKVAGDAQLHIAYAGAPLADSTTPPFEDLKARGADAVVGGSFSAASYRLSLLSFLGEQNVDPELAPLAELPVTLQWHEHNELHTINRDEVAAISSGQLIPLEEKQT